MTITEADLIDRHFEVGEAIGTVINTPTSAARVAAQRALLSFLAAEQALLGEDPVLAHGVELEREPELRTALDALDDAASCHETLEAAETVRLLFLERSRVLG